ncbi:LytTR family DNA-binding domain-containing protein [Marinimicrobium sp. ABcell2]|uniref:LytTR family DNA-binding domain-containing protein n=1 Tax=Marinimicrobium sp. ABcell2 TaxID=3069751 RepID=UPI0027AF4F22|nr:LytTR family DNA-binding domain-containing protein [Marinimicrobium sp. ABcell2]MDQ2076094.1 LytTR family DNA-binding domain-containing protein [Marinimicrobium sp. ABcell2]
MKRENWLAYRRWWEGSFWVVFLAAQAAANSIVSTLDIARNGLGFEVWEPWVWELSSAFMLLLLIPFILAVDRRFPLQRPYLRRHALVHLGFTVPFSVLHVVGMVALREWAYALLGSDYDFGHWPLEMLYEYLKDVRTYATILAFIYLYRFVLRRWQGEAQFLAQGVEEAPAEAVTDRFLVKKLGREFLVKVADIDWAESAGNYVTLHVGDRLYPLRETMANLEKALSTQGFARVHRSAILNLDRIQEIETLESGDARACLNDGTQVPVSRRYRQQLKQQL